MNRIMRTVVTDRASRYSNYPGDYDIDRRFIRRGRRPDSTHRAGAFTLHRPAVPDRQDSRRAQESGVAAAAPDGREGGGEDRSGRSDGLEHRLDATHILAGPRRARTLPVRGRDGGQRYARPAIGTARAADFRRSRSTDAFNARRRDA